MDLVVLKTLKLRLIPTSICVHYKNKHCDFPGSEISLCEKHRVSTSSTPISLDDAAHLQLNPKELSVKRSQSGHHHPHSGNL